MLPQDDCPAGVINSFMGSFAGSLTAFILPTIVYLW
jgi:hypothetical protein